jgi:hypothetical protein
MLRIATEHQEKCPKKVVWPSFTFFLFFLERFYQFSKSQNLENWWDRFLALIFKLSKNNFYFIGWALLSQHIKIGGEVFVKK